MVAERMKPELRYPAEVFYSDEDEGYIAIVPDLPGCSAFGESQSEAISELQHAIQTWVEAARKAGNPVPDPSVKTAPELPSGKVLLRLPRTLHAQLNRRSYREGVSLNTCVIMLLSEGLGRTESFTEITRVFTSRFTRAAPLSPHIRTIGGLQSSGEEYSVMSREGSIANLVRLPANQPVIYSEEQDG